MEAAGHLARHHPGAPADVLVMHQHRAVGVGTPADVAAWARGMRSSLAVPLTA